MAAINPADRTIRPLPIDLSIKSEETPYFLLFCRYINNHYAQADVNEAAGSTILRFVRRDFRQILFVNLFENKRPFFRACILSFNEALYDFFYNNNPEPALRFIQNLKKLNKDPLFNNVLDNLPALFNIACKHFFFDSLIKFIPNPTQLLINPPIAAEVSLWVVYTNTNHIFELFEILLEKVPEENPFVYLDVGSFPRELRIALFIFNRAIYKDVQSAKTLFLTLYNALYNIKNYYGKWIDDKQAITTLAKTADFLDKAPYFLSSFKRIKEIFHWAKRSLEKAQESTSLYRKFAPYVRQPDAAQKLSQLSLGRFSFNQAFRETLKGYEPQPEEEITNTRMMDTLIKGIYKCTVLILDHPLKEAEKWKDLLALPQLKKEKPAPIKPREAILPPSPKIDEQPAPILKTPPPSLPKEEEPSFEANLQSLRHQLKIFSKGFTSSHAANAFWHLEAALFRLASLTAAPQTTHQLRAFLIGLVTDLQLALEQSLTAIMRRDSETHGILSHDFYTLLYNFPEKYAPDVDVRAAIFGFNGGELHTRCLYLCSDKGNTVEKLLAHAHLDTYDPNALFAETLSYAQEAFELCITLTASFKTSSKQNLSAHFATSLAQLQPSFSSRTWEKGEFKSMKRLCEVILDLAHNRDDEIGDNLKSLVDNFIMRLEVIRKGVDSLHPIQAPVAIGDALLITQMAAEELFMNLLFLQGKNPDMAAIDHQLHLMIKELGLNIEWSQEEQQFLHKSKEVRRSIRYPNHSPSKEVQSARALAEKHPLNSFDAPGEGFKYVSKELNKTKSLIRTELTLFETICMKVLKAWEK